MLNKDYAARLRRTGNSVATTFDATVVELEDLNIPPYVALLRARAALCEQDRQLQALQERLGQLRGNTVLEFSWCNVSGFSGETERNIVFSKHPITSLIRRGVLREDSLTSHVTLTPDIS